MRLPKPFEYPRNTHQRKHGPAGYKRHREYYQWLRDEFCFRCVYCLRRERWKTLRKDWQVDHFLSKSQFKDLKLSYDNLVLACSSCNHDKSNFRVPDPCSGEYGELLVVEVDGRIHARSRLGDVLTKRADWLIARLQLADEWMLAMRQQVLIEIRDSKERLGDNPDDEIALFLLDNNLGFPDNLPDLSKETPRENTRRAGVSKSYYALKATGRLPAYY